MDGAVERSELKDITYIKNVIHNIRIRTAAAYSEVECTIKARGRNWWRFIMSHLCEDGT